MTPTTKAQRIRLRHNKKRTLIRKLRSPNTDWSQSFDNGRGIPPMEDPAILRWIVGIYGRLAGWNDMSKLGTIPRIYDDSLDSLASVETNILLGRESPSDRLNTYYILTMHARRYIAPSTISSEDGAELERLLESLLSPDKLALLRDADTLVTWHMEAGFAGMYAVLSGLECLMREPGDDREREVRDRCYAWINHQKSYMGT